ncbi:MAG TPA: hypothetical protein VJ732_17740 [Bryobacteraceae bacterium]|nr:hypothetical protein [Bryobacteraceae bacterium]
MKRYGFGFALLLLAGAATVFADDLDDALAALKSAEASKNAAKVKELAATAHATAMKYEGPAPADVDKDNWAARGRYAKDVDKYSEYALYALAIQSPPATGMDLIAALEKQNPKSEYLDRPDILIVEADNALSKNQADRALGYANRLIAAANKSAPEGVSAEEWEKMRSAALGRGYWIAGVIQGQKNLYKDCDRNLRAALPLIKGNNAMMGPALFYLGVVNYNLGKMTLNKGKLLEAAKYSQESAAIQGPYQDQAYRNSIAIKAEADRMR